jgi:hypothetical protein
MGTWKNKSLAPKVQDKIRLMLVNLWGAFHFSPWTHPVGAIPPWLPQTLGDRSKVKYSQFIGHTH